MQRGRYGFTVLQRYQFPRQWLKPSNVRNANRSRIPILVLLYTGYNKQSSNLSLESRGHIIARTYIYVCVFLYTLYMCVKKRTIIFLFADQSGLLGSLISCLSACVHLDQHSGRTLSNDTFWFERVHTSTRVALIILLICVLGRGSVWSRVSPRSLPLARLLSASA